MNDVLAIVLAVVLLPAIWYKLAVYWNPPKPNPIAFLVDGMMGIGEQIVMTTTAFEGLKVALTEATPALEDRYPADLGMGVPAQFFGIPVVINDDIGDLE